MNYRETAAEHMLTVLAQVLPYSPLQPIVSQQDSISSLTRMFVVDFAVASSEFYKSKAAVSIASLSHLVWCKIHREVQQHQSTAYTHMYI